MVHDLLINCGLILFGGVS